jgi:hypothetical protein
LAGILQPLVIDKLLSFLFNIF